MRNPAFNPWLSMWKQPRETVRAYVLNHSAKWLWMLSALSGIKFFLDNADAQDVGDQVAFGSILLLSLIIGPFLGIIYWYLLSGLLAITGKVAGLSGKWREFRQAVGLSFVPLAWAMPLWLIRLILFGSENFASRTPVIDSSVWLLLLIVLFSLVDLALGVWYLVTLSRSVAEVYDCSAWKAFGLILLSGLVFSLLLTLLLLPLVN
ncbi:YIP1 family protein [Staphylospora marina]|uniref:YIP1 family protein n=1 Tax=Staphylospora marina TaxID=2490858 RepID=UPI000F5BFB58|nr:YIP1 family protein [Staphylospora marina]